MQDINIGATIARERREAGITQDELAAHLGVTKAAVSKWELGQSLPDTALLPRIAAYFRLTLDQLFDYRPQLSAQEVGELYLSLMEQFAHDPEAAYERIDGVVADYYSCWPALLQMASLYMWRTAMEPERTGELAEKALALLSRVEEHGDDVDAVLGAKILHGSLLSLVGDVDGAIELMESLRPKRMVPVDDMLASLYEQKGDGDSALRIKQESLFWGSTNAMGSIVSQLHRVGDAERAEALLRAGEGMLEGFEFERTNPTIAIMFWGNAARACAGDRGCRSRGVVSGAVCRRFGGVRRGRDGGRAAVAAVRQGCRRGRSRPVNLEHGARPIRKRRPSWSAARLFVGRGGMGGRCR